MSGRLFAMKTVDTFADLYFNEDEFTRLQTFVEEGTAVVFCEELEDLTKLFPNSVEEIEILENKNI